MYTVLIVSSFEVSPPGAEVLYWPAGVKSKLPSGVNVSRRKKEVKVSLAYIFVFRNPGPSPPDRLGEAEDITAGRGIVDGLGDTDRLWPWPACEPNDDRRLCDVGGGFIGRARD